MVDVNTTVFNKQLEELESLADSTGLYDEAQDDDEEEVQAEPSMEWRRATLEESYSRVKRAKGRPVDPNKVYEIGTLLFEPAEGKFGRVKRSVPGYLCIQFVRGGEREYGRRPDVEAYLRENHRGKTAAELATQLGLTETEVQGHLNRLGLVRHDAIPGLENPAGVDEDRKDKSKGKAAAKPKDAIPTLPDESAKKGNKSRVPSPADDGTRPLDGPLPPRGKDLKSVLPQKGKTLPPSKAPSKAPPGKTQVPHKATGKSTPPPKGKTQPPPPPRGKSVLPQKAPTILPGKASAKSTTPRKGAMSVEDANTFIQKHYATMSNKDMEKATGLSHNTIRRKLAEWGLKRQGRD
ncbi:MAG: hypothetical protein HY904_16540 [Deltaproteobacteria bacterium]|nr:hypothetical protein [Deltaproteobacteria bacterium]